MWWGMKRGKAERERGRGGVGAGPGGREIQPKQNLKHCNIYFNFTVGTSLSFILKRQLTKYQKYIPYAHVMPASSAQLMSLRQIRDNAPALDTLFIHNTTFLNESKMKNDHRC